ncbi:hypothetical protein SAPIO_CDS4216 [Scedosporium apiospermum]|uniref:Uncharacterized protein n=1 Tax=Pseudallescheria apiosperma TaxID=563466 RepID=A0A084G8F9_PSEDA|nr:uncharacterized protein SAPIO_CDS4216 [Scedosporium apiospermum]KEZ43621.1 hypothetical protein SAPIO_CDS4216 [Scedosporium apiospermum]
MLSDTRNVNWGVLDGGPWKEQSRYPCGDEACFGAFLSLITFAFDQWERGWMETLDDIDMVVGVELSDSMDDKKWERLMFDNSFRLSKLYFTVLQVLRIASSCIEESVSDLRLVQEKWSNAVQYETTDARNVTRELEEMVTSMEAKKQRLLSRVDKKVEELLGATSLREATKAMALNQYIYIFTIVTVVYTPVGFLAAFWALPFLNNPDDSGIVRTPSAFVSTFIAVPVATYAVCLILAAYSAKKRNSISLLFELQRFLWRRSYRRWQEGEEEDSDHEATRDVSASSLSDVSKAKNSASVPPV